MTGFVCLIKEEVETCVMGLEDYDSEWGLVDEERELLNKLKDRLRDMDETLSSRNPED